MRTTVDIPEDLLRQAKAQAALRGIRLKEFIAEALHLALFGPRPQQSPARAEDSPPHRLKLREDCVFPLIRGNCGPAMRDLTAEKVHQILEEEDIERALDSGRR